MSGTQARKQLKQLGGKEARDKTKEYQRRLNRAWVEKKLVEERKETGAKKLHEERLRTDPAYRRGVIDQERKKQDNLRKAKERAFDAEVERFSKEYTGVSAQEEYKRAARSWESTDVEGKAVESIAEELKQQGWKLEQKGTHGTWYGTGPDGEDIRIADHLGFTSHEVDITVSRARTRGSIAKEVNDLFDELGIKAKVGLSKLK